MGIFDIFKKANTIECSKCHAMVKKTEVLMIDGKMCCLDCRNKMLEKIQQKSYKKYENNEFKMTVEDVFLIKNIGVVLTGKIEEGTIRLGDVVTISGKEYKVKKIDMMRKSLDYAEKGDNIGLFVDSFEPNNFKRGDIIAKSDKKTKNTFVCSVCKRELPLKYRHNEIYCSDCAQNKKEVTAETKKMVGDAINEELRSSGIVPLYKVYEAFRDKANTDDVYCERIPELIKTYKELYRQNADDEKTNKSFNDLMNELNRSLLVVPFSYNEDFEFDNDKVLHMSNRAGRKLTVDSIVYRAKKMTAEQVSNLFWQVDENGFPSPDFDWMDITRIHGSEGFSFKENRDRKSMMYINTLGEPPEQDLPCFTDVQKLLEFCKECTNLHITLYTLADIADTVNRDSIRGFVINPTTDSHCFISKNVFVKR